MVTGGLRRSVAILACVLSAAALLAGSRAAGEVTEQPLRVLQMNLCNSGIAGCYTGESVAAAAEVIRDQAPDVVTLNEVCQADVDTLRQELVNVHSGEVIVSGFRAAYDRRTASDFQCRNGELYGIGLLVRVPQPYRGYATHGDLFPVQDPDDPEERAWLCIHAVAAFYACTTHLAYTSPPVTLAQCRYLLDTAIPAVREADGYLPTVVAGDLNLRDGDPPEVRGCVPPDHLRADDGGVQHVVATADFSVRSIRSVEMAGTTDHPSLLVVLDVAARQRAALW